MFLFRKMITTYLKTKNSLHATEFLALDTYLSSFSKKKHMLKYILGTAEQCMLGIQLLSQLTCEMNQIREGVELNPTRD